MLTELRDGVWQIDCTGVNVYLVDDDVPTLVDAGTPIDGDTIRAAIEEAGFAVRDVGRLLLTHFDLDHVGAIGRIGLDAPVYVGAGDAGFLVGDEKPPLGYKKGAFQRVLRHLARGRPDEVVTVSDGDEIGSFTAYHTPGHTPGHVAYVSEERSAAFVGDLVLESGGELSASPWYLSYDTDRVADSIHDLADRAPAVEVLAMGHGTPFVRDGSVRLAELGERIEERPRPA